MQFARHDNSLHTVQEAWERNESASNCQLESHSAQGKLATPCSRNAAMCDRGLRCRMENTTDVMCTLYLHSYYLNICVWFSVILTLNIVFPYSVQRQHCSNKRKYECLVYEHPVSPDSTVETKPLSSAKSMWATLYDKITGRSTVAPTSHLTPDLTQMNFTSKHLAPASTHEQQLVDWILSMAGVG